MPVYDCRTVGAEPGAVRFPCNVRVLDPATGEPIRDVFYLATAPARVGRFLRDAAGRPLASPGRRTRWADDGRGGRKLVVENDRLDVWEARPWVAVAADTGEVVAKSEGCP